MTSSAKQAIQSLTQRRLTLAVAESCTGGLIGHLLTEVPGSSQAFLGGVVAYHNRAKVAILGVDEALLEREGAVSEAVARAMAEGVRRLFGSDPSGSSPSGRSLGLAVTGIAGPTGGTPEKPVGLTYVALAHGATIRCQRYLWTGDRTSNKARSAEAALNLVIEHLSKTP